MGVERPQPTTILVADGHDILRAGLRAILQRHTDLRVVAEARTCDEALACALDCRPHLALVATDLPGHGGIHACREITALTPTVRVLLVARVAEAAETIAAIHAGAGGYVLATAVAERLLLAVRAVAEGEIFLDPAIAGPALGYLDRGNGSNTRPDPLSEREREVLTLLADGHTNRRIAERLSVSEATVKTHVSHILEKMGVPRRIDAARQAIHLGLGHSA